MNSRFNRSKTGIVRNATVLSPPTPQTLVNTICFLRSHSVRRIISALSLPGIVITFLVPRIVSADILAQYTFGPDGTTPGILTPATVDGNATATSIQADAGLVLDLTSPAIQPASTPYLRTTFTNVSSTPNIAITNNADFKFTLTANAGFLLDLTSLAFDVMLTFRL